MTYPITEYIERAMAHAEYSLLEEDSFAGRIPLCIGVLAFGKTLTACQEELRSTLEDWILIGLRLGHELPVIDGIDLSINIEAEQLEAV
ncbi:MAG: type II toxin-antitoxin system HicB family antitoxin [Calditrichaeota bacterium]|nr:type II toxin-antitoxin system HicB family antitoxin [Calditrichota bacterium]